MQGVGAPKDELERSHVASSGVFLFFYIFKCFFGRSAAFHLATASSWILLFLFPLPYNYCCLVCSMNIYVSMFLALKPFLSIVCLSRRERSHMSTLGIDCEGEQYHGHASMHIICFSPHLHFIWPEASPSVGWDNIMDTLIVMLAKK